VKYLVVQRRRDGVQVPPDAVAGMLLAQRDWLDEKIQDGAFDVAYGLAQGGGGVAIVNADTPERLNEILTESPLFGISNVELTPLADVHTTIGNGVRAMQRMAGVPA
jgi:muconolactone delta-isomerase